MVAYARAPIPPAPGRTRKVDYEYRRQGTANLFMFCEPLTGWRSVRVTKWRTKRDWAEVVVALPPWRYLDKKSKKHYSY